MTADYGGTQSYKSTSVSWGPHRAREQNNVRARSRCSKLNFGRQHHTTWCLCLERRVLAYSQKRAKMRKCSQLTKDLSFLIVRETKGRSSSPTERLKDYSHGHIWDNSPLSSSSDECHPHIDHIVICLEKSHNMLLLHNTWSTRANNARPHK